MTVQQLINASLRDLNWIRPGQTPSTDESNDAFLILNEILSNWSQEGLLVPTHAVTQFSLTAGTATYTMGVGATWLTTGLPIKIKGAVASILGFEKGLKILSMGDFQASILDETGRQDALPQRLGYDDAAPMRNIALWPTPSNSAAVIVLSYWVPLAPFVALTDVVTFALPAFEQAIRDELALRQATLFPPADIPPLPQLAAKAQASKLALTRLDPSEIPSAPMQPQQVVPVQQVPNQQ